MNAAQTRTAINAVLTDLKGEDITATLTFWDGTTMVLGDAIHAAWTAQDYDLALTVSELVLG